MNRTISVTCSATTQRDAQPCQRRTRNITRKRCWQHVRLWQQNEYRRLMVHVGLSMDGFTVDGRPRYVGVI